MAMNVYGFCINLQEGVIRSPVMEFLCGGTLLVSCVCMREAGMRRKSTQSFLNAHGLAHIARFEHDVGRFENEARARDAHTPNSFVSTLDPPPRVQEASIGRVLISGRS